MAALKALQEYTDWLGTRNNSLFPPTPSPRPTSAAAQQSNTPFGSATVKEGIVACVPFGPVASCPTAFLDPKAAILRELENTTWLCLTCTVNKASACLLHDRLDSLLPLLQATYLSQWLKPAISSLWAALEAAQQLLGSWSSVEVDRDDGAGVASLWWALEECVEDQGFEQCINRVDNAIQAVVASCRTAAKFPPHSREVIQQAKEADIDILAQMLLEAVSAKPGGMLAMLEGANVTLEGLMHKMSELGCNVSPLLDRLLAHVDACGSNDTPSPIHSLHPLSLLDTLSSSCRSPLGYDALGSLQHDGLVPTQQHAVQVYGQPKGLTRQHSGLVQCHAGERLNAALDDLLAAVNALVAVNHHLQKKGVTSKQFMLPSPCIKKNALKGLARVNRVGGSVDLFVADYQGSKVSVRRARVDESDEHVVTRELLWTALCMDKLPGSRCVMQVLGVVPEMGYALVTEHMHSRSLHDYLLCLRGAAESAQEQQQLVDCGRERLLLAWQVACAVEYLHKQSKSDYNSDSKSDYKFDFYSNPTLSFISDSNLDPNLDSKSDFRSGFKSDGAWSRQAAATRLGVLVHGDLHSGGVMVERVRCNLQTDGAGTSQLRLKLASFGTEVVRSCKVRRLLNATSAATIRELCNESSKLTQMGPDWAQVGNKNLTQIAPAWEQVGINNPAQLGGFWEQLPPIVGRFSRSKSCPIPSQSSTIDLPHCQSHGRTPSAGSAPRKPPACSLSPSASPATTPRGWVSTNIAFPPQEALSPFHISPTGHTTTPGIPPRRSYSSTSSYYPTSGREKTLLRSASLTPRGQRLSPNIPRTSRTSICSYSLSPHVSPTTQPSTHCACLPASSHHFPLWSGILYAGDAAVTSHPAGVKFTPGGPPQSNMPTASPLHTPRNLALSCPSPTTTPCTSHFYPKPTFAACHPPGASLPLPLPLPEVHSAAPERLLIMGDPVLDNSSIHTRQTDVYSLGAILYEIFTCSLPYGPRSLSPAELYESICRGDKPDMGPLKSVSPHLAMLVEQCMSYAPRRRPCAQSIVISLKRVIRDEYGQQVAVPQSCPDSTPSRWEGDAQYDTECSTLSHKANRGSMQQPGVQHLLLNCASTASLVNMDEASTHRDAMLKEWRVKVARMDAKFQNHPRLVEWMEWDNAHSHQLAKLTAVCTLSNPCGQEQPKSSLVRCTSGRQGKALWNKVAQAWSSRMLKMMACGSATSEASLKYQ